MSEGHEGSRSRSSRSPTAFSPSRSSPSCGSTGPVESSSVRSPWSCSGCSTSTKRGGPSNGLDAARLPRTPYVFALAMSANIGSVMAIVGNPQNMLIHVYGAYDHVAFSSRQLPVGLAGLAGLCLVPMAFFRTGSSWRSSPLSSSSWRASARPESSSGWVRSRGRRTATRRSRRSRSSRGSPSSRTTSSPTCRS